MKSSGGVSLAVLLADAVGCDGDAADGALDHPRRFVIHAWSSTPFGHPCRWPSMPLGPEFGLPNFVASYPFEKMDLLSVLGELDDAAPARESARMRIEHPCA